MANLRVKLATSFINFIVSSHSLYESKYLLERIPRNPLWKQKIMAREMVVAPCTMSHIIKQDLKLSVYRRCTGQRLTAPQEQKHCFSD